MSSLACVGHHFVLQQKTTWTVLRKTLFSFQKLHGYHPQSSKLYSDVILQMALWLLPAEYLFYRVDGENSTQKLSVQIQTVMSAVWLALLAPTWLLGSKKLLEAPNAISFARFFEKSAGPNMERRRMFSKTILCMPLLQDWAPFAYHVSKHLLDENHEKSYSVWWSMKVLLQATKSAPNPPFMNAIVKLMAPCLQKIKSGKSCSYFLNNLLVLQKVCKIDLQSCLKN